MRHSPIQSPPMSFKLVLTFVVALTIMEFRTLFQIHRDQEGKMSAVAELIADGRASSKAYQSRLAGPYIIRAYSRLTGASPWASFEIFALGTLLCGNLLAYRIGRETTGHPAGAWAMCFANVAAFLILQDWNWLYPWDFIDAITMLWLAYLIWMRASVGWFWLLFAAELFNREAAAYIGLWLLVDSAADLLRRRNGSGSASRAISGLAMVAVTVVVTHMLRATWSPAYATESPRFPQIMGGQEWHLPDNIYFLIRPMQPTRAIPLFILGGFAFVMLRAIFDRQRNAVRISLWVCGILGINLLLAVLVETRIWISVVPLILPVLFEPRLKPEDLDAELPADQLAFAQPQNS